jgi:hypothetical protein
MIGVVQSVSCMIFIILGYGSTVFMEGSSITWKNTSSGSTAFMVPSFASSSTSVFFDLSICWSMNPLKFFPSFEHRLGISPGFHPLPGIPSRSSWLSLSNLFSKCNAELPLLATCEGLAILLHILLYCCCTYLFLL